MNEPNENSFLKFLDAGIERGGFGTDDVLAAVIRVRREMLVAHAAGLVAPLKEIADLPVKHEGQMLFDSGKAESVKKNPSRIEQMQTLQSHALEVVGASRRTAEIDSGSLVVTKLDI